MPDENLQAPGVEYPQAPSKPAEQEEATAQESMPAEEKTIKKYLRFDAFERVEHWIFMASFTTLAITGLVQKFSDSPLSVWIVRTLGGIENTRLIHHTAATIMLLVVVYHIGAVGYRIYVRRARPTMLPSLEDVKAALGAVGYEAGFRKHPPQQGRYTFEEKVEYWAVVWGTVIMAVTGFMMWNPIATTKLLSGEFVPAAKIAHGMEAILAALSILIWHFYHVLVKTFNRSMFNGKLNEEQMLHEHPLELADIKAGLATRPVDPAEVKRRQRRFWPVYGFIAIVMLLGVYFFVNGEQTAIATIPPVTTEVIYAPLTPTPLPTLRPSSTPGAAIATSWNGGIAALFQSKCSACHNSSNKMGGLDLSTYQGALAGGANGAAVVPGDPATSVLITKQAAGGHPGQLTPEELQVVTDWIKNGASEQ
jgi:formate dehydrogenase gamma subunit